MVQLQQAHPADRPEEFQLKFVTVGPAFSFAVMLSLRLSTELAICPNALRDPLRKLVGEKTGTGASVKHGYTLVYLPWTVVTTT